MNSATLTNEILIPLDKFDLKAFIGRIVSFVSQQGRGNPAPLTSIPVVEKDGTTPDLYKSGVDRVPHDEILEDKKAVYFPFSSSNTGDPILCADGRKYDVPRDDDEQLKSSGNFTMGTENTFGFLVEVSRDFLAFRFAKQYFGQEQGPASVTVINNTTPFDEGMRNFLDAFKAE